MLKRVRTVAIKIEDSPGIAEVLADADAAITAYDAIAQPSIEAVPREGQGGFSPIASSLGARKGTITFKTDFIGGATGPFWASVILPTCGWVLDTGVYGPVSEEPGANVKTATVAIYQNGKVKKLRGAMANLVITLVAGQPTFAEVTYTGIWVPPVDVAILTPTYPTAMPIRFASAGLLIGGSGGWQPLLRQMTIDLGNDVQMIEDPNDSSGYQCAHIVGRRIVGSIDPKASLVAGEDTYGKWLAYNERAMAIDMGTTGNRVTIAAPKLQLINPQEADRNGSEVDNIQYQLNRSGSTTDTDLTFAFS